MSARAGRRAYHPRALEAAQAIEGIRRERRIALAVKAADALPLDASQQDRYRVAVELAREHGDSAVNLLPVINGRMARRSGSPPVVPLRGDGSGYERGYLAGEGRA